MRVTIEVEAEPIEVTSNAPRPDPSWRFTDAAGHAHAWDGGDLPTLTSVPDGAPYWCETCNDVHQDTVTVCAVCGEQVTPGTLSPPPYREFIRGRLRGRLIVEDVIDSGRRRRTWHLTTAELEVVKAGDDGVRAVMAARPPDEGWGQWDG